MTSAIIADASASTLVAEQKPSASKNRSLSHRSLVYGLGTNDCSTPITLNGVRLKSYDHWKSMLTRCYSSAFHRDRPSYIGCSVAPEWLLFSTFEEWFKVHYVKGFALDKDLLVPGNRVYSPDTCVFVPPALNGLLEDKAAGRGDYPLGVSLCKQCPSRYRAQVAGTKSGGTYLGLFSTPLEAHQAWQLAKALIIEQFPTDNPRIRKALDLRVAQLRDDHANNRITTKL